MTTIIKSNCQICGALSSGYHFGVISCRACAAFFRRALLSKKVRKTCKFDNKCTDFSGEIIPPCKSCRMKKCVKKGMLSRNLQLQRNSKISQSIEEFIGRPHMVIFTTNTIKKRNYVDVKSLIYQAYGILNLGAPTPLNHMMSPLERMAFGVSYNTKKCTQLTIVSKDSFSKIWEFDFFSAARWLTHMEGFSRIPISIQMQLLQSIWHVFGRIYKTRTTAELRKRLGDSSKSLNLSDKFYLETDKIEFDMSWLTHYPFEELKVFFFGAEECGSDILVDSLIKLDSSPVELTYMTAQLCFQYASNRYSGTEMSDICDQFQTIIDNDLHRYYMREENLNKNYAGRLAQMLKINQLIQRSIRLQREKSVIAKTFDIFIADYSHPEMFVDTGC